MSPGSPRHAAVPDAASAVLLVSCPDRPGLVAGIAALLHEHGANILAADQHTDRRAGMFFQRVHFEMRALPRERATLERAIGRLAEPLDMQWRLHSGDERKRVALFVSKYDHCLWDLLLRHRAGEIDCDIPLIVSNHPDLEPVARLFAIPFHVFPISRENKLEQEAAELALLEARRVDLIVLARYMQVLSDGFCERYPGRIINIHHSFLPAFMGPRPYQRAWERGVKRIGATAHYATPELDEGPIIEQDVIRCTHADDVPDLVRKGRDVERAVLSRAVRWHLEDRILVCANKTVVFA